MKAFDRMMVILRPHYSRPLDSTRDELAHEIVARRKITRKTNELAKILADYRRQDGLLR